ncbi:MAG TPA: pilus assembly protein N-terminal domain-containing protein [Bryobacteraceae bacterium]|nr:pilus assembly protein N-terminal domain-containing protein [Bryobacteraceae bacterium]
MRAAFLLTACVALSSLAQEPRTQELTLTVGRSALLDFAAEIGRISTSNPDITDAVAASTREVLLNAKAPGTSTVVIWTRGGERALYHVAVEPNLEPLRRLISGTFPKEPISVQAARDSLSLNGTVTSQAVADRAAALAAPFSKTVVNNLAVAPGGPERQILLRVRFAELNRNATSSFGVNLVSTGALNTPGSLTTGQFQPPRAAELAGSIGASAAGASTKFTISDVLNVFAFRPDLNLAAFIKALQSQGLLQILAEPNLVAANGKEASFLVGGEFPVPIVQGGQSAGAVTIVFKEFGIRLTFTPTVTDHGTVRMHVRPEVSTIDQANSVLFSGFVIPALATRRMETHIELADGQSFVIAGLIDDRVTETVMKIPGLSSIPLLGNLFRSRQENKAKTELIVMVTPEVAAPIAAGQPVPQPVMPKEFLTPLLVAPRPRERSSTKR